MKKKVKVSPSTKKRVAKQRAAPPMPIAEPFVVPPAAPVDQTLLDPQTVADSEHLPPLPLYEPEKQKNMDLMWWYIIGSVCFIIIIIIWYALLHPHHSDMLPFTLFMGS